MGFECRLVRHGGNPPDQVAEVEQADPIATAELDEVEDVHDPGAAPGLIRIKIKIDRVHPAFGTVHDRYADQPVINPVPDLKASGNCADKKSGILLLCGAFALGKADF